MEHEKKEYREPLLYERGYGNLNKPDYYYNEKSFVELLNEYFNELKKYDITQNMLSSLTGLNTSTVSAILCGERKPSVYSLVALCIAMKLYFLQSMLLMKKAGIALDDTNEADRIYIKYLNGCGYDDDLNVVSCNKELEEHHYRKLTNFSNCE